MRSARGCARRTTNASENLIIRTAQHSTAKQTRRQTFSGARRLSSGLLKGPFVERWRLVASHGTAPHASPSVLSALHAASSASSSVLSTSSVFCVVCLQHILCDECCNGKAQSASDSSWTRGGHEDAILREANPLDPPSRFLERSICPTNRQTDDRHSGARSTAQQRSQQSCRRHSQPLHIRFLFFFYPFHCASTQTRVIK